jgi:hypothetical protein
MSNTPRNGHVDVLKKLSKEEFAQRFSKINGGFKVGVWRNTHFLKILGLCVLPVFFTMGTYRILFPFNYESKFRKYREGQKQSNLFFNFSNSTYL